MTPLRILLIIVIIILVVAILIPFVLKTVGLSFPFFGTRGSSRGAVTPILRSTDGGATWEAVSVSRNESVSFPDQVYDVAFDPDRVDMVFAGTSAGLWKSTDQGVTWEGVRDGAGVLPEAAEVYRIRISPVSSKIMYVASTFGKRGRLLRSEDGGASFREIYFTGEEQPGVYDIILDPTSPNHIIIATGEGGILESQNGGRTWSVKKIFTEGVQTLLVNDRFLDEMYAVTESGNVWKTYDGGEQWADLGEGMQSPTIAGVVADTSSSFEVYDQSSFSLFGQSASAEILPRIIIDAEHPTIVYAGTSQGLLRSTNGGFVWEKLNVLIPRESLPVGGVLLNHRNSSIIVAVAGSAVYRSDDGGAHWTKYLMPTGGRAVGIYTNPWRPGVLFSTFSE